MLNFNVFQLSSAAIISILISASIGARQGGSNLVPETSAQAPKQEYVLNFVDREAVERDAKTIVKALNPKKVEVDPAGGNPKAIADPLPSIVAVSLSGRKKSVIVQADEGQYETLVEGDVWEKWTVGKIESTQVEFLKDGKSSTYSLFSETDERPASDKP